MSANTQTKLDVTPDNAQRRSVLLGASAAALAALLTPIAKATEHATEHVHPERNKSLIDAAHHCVSTGGACISHCMDTFKSGDTSLAQCATTAQDVIAVCNAMAQLSLNNSTQVKEMAKVCQSACETCKTECEKHAATHPACKDCADACTAMIEQASKVG